MKEYDVNNDFKNYVDKYARDNNISVEQALQHRLVVQTESYYREKRISKAVE